MAELSTQAVEELFRQCLAPAAVQGTVVEGIVTRAAFRPEAIAAHRGEIGALLAELPDPFLESGGGGWSFLNACNDRHGRQWTSYQQTMEHLFMLGLASGLVTELLPRELWPALPGGMPYYAVHKEVRERVEAAGQEGPS
jgi:hypothetical protein